MADAAPVDSEGRHRHGADARARPGPVTTTPSGRGGSQPVVSQGWGAVEDPLEVRTFFHFMCTPATVADVPPAGTCRSAVARLLSCCRSGCIGPRKSYTSMSAPALKEDTRTSPRGCHHR